MSTFDDIFEAIAAPVAEAEHGVTVVFSRGGVSSDPFVATAHDVVRSVVDEHGLLTQVESRVFCLPVVSVVVNSAAVTPRAGDRLTLTENGSERIFEVLPQSKTMPAVSLLTGGYRWRVFTKLV